jgi:hypothetical protein
MRSALFLALLFAFLLTLEASCVWALGGIALAIPVMTIGGLLVMHRSSVADGIAWFFLLAIIRHDLVSLILCLVAPFFLLRIFSTRSVYALFGFGITSYAVSLAIIATGQYLLGVIGIGTGHILPDHPIIQTLFLLPGLYIGTVLVRSLQKHFFSRVALKSAL